MVKLYDHDVKKFVCNQKVNDPARVSVLFSPNEAYIFGSILGWLFLRDDLNLQEEEAIGLTIHRLVKDKKSISYDHFYSIYSYWSARGRHSPTFELSDQYLKPNTRIFQRQLYRGIRSTGAIDKGMMDRYEECLKRSIARTKYRTT